MKVMWKELAPFETLQHAINQLTAGDILYVREGTYRETITIDEDGSSGNLITIQNYNNEVVTIDGTSDITGTWSTYGGCFRSISIILYWRYYSTFC